MNDTINNTLGKKIAFYPTQEVREWYDALPRYKGSAIINEVLHANFIDKSITPNTNLVIEERVRQLEKEVKSLILRIGLAGELL